VVVVSLNIYLCCSMSLFISESLSFKSVLKLDVLNGLEEAAAYDTPCESPKSDASAAASPAAFLLYS